MSKQIIERSQLFGTDLRLSEAGLGYDLYAGFYGDLCTVTGIDNLTQALTIRLLVHKGELTSIGLPQYGSRLSELIGEPVCKRTSVMAMAYAREALKEDPRVVDVKDMSVLVSGKTELRLEMKVYVINEPVPLNLVHIVNLEQI